VKDVSLEGLRKGRSKNDRADIKGEV